LEDDPQGDDLSGWKGHSGQEEEGDMHVGRKRRLIPEEGGVTHGILGGNKVRDHQKVSVQGSLDILEKNLTKQKFLPID